MRDRPVEPEFLSELRGDFRRGIGRNEQVGRVPRRGLQQDKRQREDQPDESQRGETATNEVGHGVIMARSPEFTQGQWGQTPLIRRVIRWGVTVLVLACAPDSRSDVVVFASGADLESANPLVTIHPLARQVQRHALFVTLTRLDSSLTQQPYLARRWEWSADRRRLTMHLFASLRWHDGKPTTARDVAFTVNAARDPATGFPRASDLAMVDSIIVEDDSTAVFGFRSSPPGLLPIFAELPIVPEHLLRDVPRSSFRSQVFATSPTGNGPYRFVRREPGRRWIFERVADFPSALGGPAQVRRLVIAVVDEATTKFAGLTSGDLHVAGISPTMASLVERDPALRVMAYPVSFATVIVFNSARSPFDDVRVRQAVDALINRQRIIDVALAGYGSPAEGPVSASHPWVRGHTRPSPAQADSLLDVAGWRSSRDGARTRGSERLKFTLFSVGSGDNAIEQLIQADLRTHGITVDIRQLELGAFLAMARQSPKQFDALYTGISGDLSLSHLASMFDGRLSGGALDYAGYHTPNLDSLFRSVSGAGSDAELATSWRSIQETLATEVPVSWIYHARGVQGLSRRLQHVRMDLRGEMATLVLWRLESPGTP
jgi:peptide/nickel transport system substrate-binding protein